MKIFFFKWWENVIYKVIYVEQKIITYIIIKLIKYIKIVKCYE